MLPRLPYVTEPPSRAVQLAALGVGLPLLAVVGAIDAWTGPELSFSLFYLLPISLVPWLAPPAVGWVAALLAALTWLAAAAAAGASYSHPAIPYWNAAVRLGIFALFALLLSTLRYELDRERRLARLDPLTEVLNVRGLAQAATAEIERLRRHGQPLTALYVDLDDFKQVNDRLGHAAGDRLLQQVAQTLRQQVRGLDSVARMGGDEFLVLLPGADQRAGVAVLARLRSELASQSIASGATFSAGLVTFHRPPRSVDELIGRADELMYQSKQRAKGTHTGAEVAV